MIYRMFSKYPNPDLPGTTSAQLVFRNQLLLQKPTVEISFSRIILTTRLNG